AVYARDLGMTEPAGSGEDQDAFGPIGRLILGDRRPDDGPKHHKSNQESEGTSRGSVFHDDLFLVPDETISMRLDAAIVRRRRWGGNISAAFAGVGGAADTALAASQAVGFVDIPVFLRDA